MRCETCQGSGRVLPMTSTHLLLSYYPCPTCNGSSTAYCCEGERGEQEVEMASRDDVEQPDQAESN